MRLYWILFFLVLIAVLVFSFVNASTLMRSTQVVVPFMGSQVVPMRLFGLLSLIGLAGIYSLFWSLSSTRAKAKSADLFDKIENLRETLNREEASRFKALEQQLEAQFREVLNRLEPGSVPAPKAGGFLGGLFARETQTNQALPSTRATTNDLETLIARIEKVRDELAADIALSEQNVLKALEQTDAGLIAKDRPRSHF
jgi:hypothetical protein